MKRVLRRPAYGVSFVGEKRPREYEDEIEISPKKIQRTGDFDPPEMPPTPPTLPETVNKNSFTFYCLNMGQGDCTLIKLPNGKWMMIDCGSKAGQEVYPKAIEKIGTLLPNKRLDYLILTHADTDHYNQLKKVLKLGEESLNIHVDNVYFSYGSSLSAGFTSYGIGHLIMTKLKPKTITKVSINTQEKLITTWNNGDNYADEITQDLMQPFYTFLSGPENGGWQISFLAGNVKPTGKATNPVIKNTASIVTLFQILGQTVLMRGDATNYTDNFVVSNNGNLSRNVTFCSIAHHGAFLHNCNSAANIAHYAPQRSLVSVRYQHQLPEWEAINTYLNYASQRTTQLENIITGWVRGDVKNVNSQKSEAALILQGWIQHDIQFTQRNITDKNGAIIDTYYVRSDVRTQNLGAPLPICTTKTNYIQVAMNTDKNVYSTYDFEEVQVYKRFNLPIITYPL